jgi:hypothetical protein
MILIIQRNIDNLFKHSLIDLRFSNELEMLLILIRDRPRAKLEL